MPAVIIRMPNIKPISVEEATNLLRQKAESEEIGDRLYEMANILAQGAINEIEAEFKILDADGNLVSHASDGTEWYDKANDGTEWYDEAKEDFVKIILERICAFCKE